MDSDSRLTQLLSSTPVVPDYSRLWSALGRKLKRNLMRADVLTVTDKTIVLDMGQPNASLSPLTELKFHLSGVGDVRVEKTLLDKLAKYHVASGLSELKEFLLDLQRREHLPPQMMTKAEAAELKAKDGNGNASSSSSSSSMTFDLSVTCGIAEAFQVCIEMMLDEEEDTILMEDVSYGNFIFNVRMIGANIRAVSVDDDGILPEALEDVLKNWDQRCPGKRPPKLLYTIPLGHNPRGYSWSLGRMVEVYAICRKYDVVIIDDGAYHFLQFGERSRSFQSFDVDGRVIRFDTFSKIIGAGYRLGWVSGPSAIVDKINIRHEMTCAHSSLLVQAVIYSMLQQWGVDGFETRVRSVAEFYQKQSQYAVNACDKYLSGLATWNVPKGGMFLWIVLKKDVFNDDINPNTIVKELKDVHDIQIRSSIWYHADSGTKSSALRLCYSAASQGELEHATKCLAQLLIGRRKTAESSPTGSVR